MKLIGICFSDAEGKSQGSEGKHIGIELPYDSGSRILTRNLLYPGITRSKGQIDLFGSRGSLEDVMKIGKKKL